MLGVWGEPFLIVHVVKWEKKVYYRVKCSNEAVRGNKNGLFFKVKQPDYCIDLIHSST